MTKNHKLIYWLIFSFGLSLLIFIQYYGLIHFNYLVPPGDDGANHLNIIMPIFNKESTFLDAWKNALYPPAYHVFIAKVSQLLNTHPLQVMLWFYPLILILSSISIFIFTYTIFGPIPGLLSFILYGFTARTPIQLLNDGGYPNLIAGHIFLPLFLTLVILAYQQNKRRKIFFTTLAIILAILIILTHHITTFILIGLFLIFIPVFLLIQRQYPENNKKFIFVTLISFLFAFLLLVFLYFRSDLFAPARNLASLMIRPTNNFPFIKIINHLTSPAAIIGITDFPARIGRLIVYTGSIGLFCLPFILKNNIKNFIFPLTIIFCWTILLAAGSQLTFLTNPERLARDLSVPLSIIGGTTIYYLWLRLSSNYSFLLIILFVLSISYLGYSSTRDRITNALKYEPMVRFTQADKKMADYINHQQDGDKILVYSYNYYLPYFINPNYKVISAYSLDDKKRYDLSYINGKFDFLYVSNFYNSWLPPTVLPKLVDDFSGNGGLKEIKMFEDTTNSVYLFDIL